MVYCLIKIDLTATNLMGEDHILKELVATIILEWSIKLAEMIMIKYQYKDLLILRSQRVASSNN